MIRHLLNVLKEYYRSARICFVLLPRCLTKYSYRPRITFETIECSNLFVAIYSFSRSACFESVYRLRLS